jgi:uncharacterized membrane protein
MAFFIGLLSTSTAVWLVSKHLLGIGRFQTFRSAAQLAVAIMFVQTGIMHLLNPEAFTYMIEGLILYPYLMVYLSGVAEIILGLGVLFPKTRQLSAWLLILMLLAIFPANINVAVNDLPSPGGLPSSGLYRWSRLVFQPVYIYWVYKFIISKNKNFVSKNKGVVKYPSAFNTT